MSREMVNSGIPWIGEIPKYWTIELIGNQVKEVDNPNTNGEECNALQFKMGTIISKSKGDSKYNPETLEGYNIVDKGVIMLNGLNLSFDFISQRVGLVKERGVITSTYLAVKPTPNIDSEFLTYLFKAYDNCKAFHSMGRGLRQTLSYGELRKYLLVYPPLSEQQSIAEFLDRKCAEVDEMIALQEQIIEELKAYKQSVITEAVTKGLNPDVPMKDSGIEWIGEIPEHWKMCRVKDILEAGKDGIKIGPFGSSLTNKVNGDGECKIYGQWNIVNKDFTAGKNFVSAETYKELDAYKIVAGDILVSMMGTIGKCAIIPNGLQDGIMDSHVIKIRINKSTINPEYFELMYDKDNSTFIFEQLSRMKKGSIMDGLNSSIVKRLNLLLPPIDEQQEIVSYLLEKRSKIESLISIKLLKIDSLKEYKKSIIYEYITGKREVE